MARIVKPLTDKQIQSSKSQEKQYQLSDGKGLFLLIMPTGAKLWRFNYINPISEKRTALGIGSYPELSLAMARQIRDEYRKLLANKIDPQENNKQIQDSKITNQSNTFYKMAEQWKNKKASQVKEYSIKKSCERLEKHVDPYIANVPVKELNRQQIIDFLRPLEECGKLDTLKRVVSLINQILDFSVDCGAIEYNPCLRIIKAFAVHQEQHLATISYKELPEFLEKLHSTDKVSFVVKNLVMWQLLTMVRPKEAVSVEWSEIDFEKQEWTIPAEKMKGKKGHNNYHVVPLSKQALIILSELRPFSAHSKFVFPNRTKRNDHMSSQTANMAIKRAGFEGRLTAHGLRALASTTLNEKSSELNFNPDAIEACLAHKIAGEVRKAYNRSTYLDERRNIMDWWGDFIYSTDT